MAAIHLLSVGIIFLLITVVVAVIQRGTTGKSWWRIIGSLILVTVIPSLVAGLNWSALFH
jgi:putative effector of murein hydrolase LrgA (UPF0299 family)